MPFIISKEDNLLKVHEAIIIMDYFIDIALLVFKIK